MIYIMMKEKEEKEDRFVLGKIYHFFSRRNSKLKIDHYDGHTVITLNNLERNSLKRLSKFLELNCTSLVCISDNLRSNEEFIGFLKEKGVGYFEGNWLFKYLLLNLIEYIVQNKKDRMEYQDVSILTNNINENIVDTIREIALKVKTLNIVTKNEKIFSKIEKELYAERGIILNINNNYSKSLKKSGIIINYDFSEEEINKYSISRNACFINVGNNKAKINSKSFEGININSYNIKLPNKYFYGEWQEKFNKSILYESFIYKNTLTKNIREELKNDNIVIDSLNGISGIIRKNEYLKIAKKY